MSRRPVVLCSVFCAAFLVRVAAGAAQAVPAGPLKTTTSGVYTTAQAAKGEETYMTVCVSCHVAGTYKTPQFRSTWNGRLLSELFTLISEGMPKNAPGSLAPEEYADLVAYVLKVNEMPAGKTELPADPAALKQIRIEMPASGGPVNR